jgi:hypothetical protein
VGKALRAPALSLNAIQVYTNNRLMPYHFQLINNPRDGRIKEFLRDLKSRA